MLEKRNTPTALAAAGYLNAGRGVCQYCLAKIEWWITPPKPNGLGKKRMAFDVFEDGTLQVHWLACPKFDETRRKKAPKKPRR